MKSFRLLSFAKRFATFKENNFKIREKLEKEIDGANKLENNDKLETNNKLENNSKLENKDNLDDMAGTEGDCRHPVQFEKCCKFQFHK